MSTNVSISQIAKEKETFQDVLPSIIGSLMTNPKLSQIPEVGSWVKQVPTSILHLAFSSGYFSAELGLSKSYTIISKKI